MTPILQLPILALSLKKKRLLKTKAVYKMKTHLVMLETIPTLIPTEFDILEEIEVFFIAQLL